MKVIHELLISVKMILYLNCCQGVHNKTEFPQRRHGFRMLIERPEDRKTILRNIFQRSQSLLISQSKSRSSFDYTFYVNVIQFRGIIKIPLAKQRVLFIYQQNPIPDLQSTIDLNSTTKAQIHACIFVIGFCNQINFENSIGQSTKLQI